MLLNEIVGVKPLPYQWIDNNSGKFMFNDILFGIVIETVNISLSTRDIRVANIAFGVVKDKSKPIEPNNIDRSLTGFGKPLTIYSTVAAACVENKHLHQVDVIMLGAADAVRDKRSHHYLRAITELANKIPEFKTTVRLKAPNGNIAVVVSKTEFSDEEKQQIVDITGLGKI